MAEELKKVRFRPLINGNFVLDAYTKLGYHLEKELRYPEVESAVMTQYNIDIVFKTGKRYTIWFRDIDFSHISVPLYVKGYRVKSNYYHALYAVIAEVSYYTRGLSKEINRDYLLNTKELAKFYVNRDLDIIIKILIKAAGGVEQSS